MECGKAVGLFVGDNDSDWESIIRFAQDHEDQNKEARTRGRSKKKAARELLSLKTSVNYVD